MQLAPGVWEWDYEDFPSHCIREQRCAQVLIDLDRGVLTANQHACDSRPVHFSMFKGMTLPGEEYFVGNYRGANFPGLLNYYVGVGQDCRVGVAPSDVSDELARFEVLVERAVNLVLPLQGSREPKDVVVVVGVACTLLVEFLRIHPYANGNGHMGRFIVWAVLLLARVRPRRWPLNEKLPHPYGELLSRYRDGDRNPLIRFVLSHL